MVLDARRSSLAAGDSDTFAHANAVDEASGRYTGLVVGGENARTLKSESHEFED